MNVTILVKPYLDVLVLAIRNCTDSFDKGDSDYEEQKNEFVLGERDEALIKNCIKQGHESVLEHMSFSFYIEGISRACLQELARHRMASMSVQSTRYTLKKIFNKWRGASVVDCRDYLASSGNDQIDYMCWDQLTALAAGHEEFTNDQLKYAIPEAFKTSLVWTINARSLRNFFTLRTSPKALKEIRELSYAIYEEIPEEFHLLFEDIMDKKEEEESNNA